MNGNSFLIDTNIILYLLGGNQTVFDILYEHDLYVSFISQLELLSYRNINNAEEIRIKRFISDCSLIDINESIKQNVITIRKQVSLKLPDCIIAATAMHLGIPLLTADKNFKQLPEISVVIYNE